MAKPLLFSERIVASAYTGEEAKFYTNDTLVTGNEYEFTPDGIGQWIYKDFTNNLSSTTSLTGVERLIVQKGGIPVRTTLQSIWDNSPFYTITEINDLLDDKADITDLDNYVQGVTGTGSILVDNSDSQNPIISLVDGDFVTEAELTDILDDYALITSLATVATSGSYNDLKDIPVIDRVDVLPTLNLDLADINGAPFKGNLTRATNGGYRLNSRGVLVPTAVNEPVIDYANDGKPKGTGFFGAYTNLLLRSEEFDNAAWSKFDLTAAQNAVVAPDGNTTADKITETATTAVHYVAQAVAISSGAVVTTSWFLKAGERSDVQLRLGGVGGNINCRVNLANGTIALSAPIGPFSNAAASIEALANGWYRVSITATTTGITSLNVMLIFGAPGSDNYLGVVGSGLFVWGAQLTQTAFPVPYVPTTSAAVVRNADSFVIGGSDFTDFFNPLEGTFFVEGYAPRATTGTPRVVQLDDVTNDNRHAIFFNPGSQAFQGLSVVGGVAQATGLVLPIAAGAAFRSAFSYRANLFNFALNGALAPQDISGAVPSGLTRLFINGEPNESIRRLIYWPKALTATDLQRITA